MSKDKWYTYVPEIGSFSLLYYDKEADELLVHPVISWRISVTGNKVNPVTPIGVIKLWSGNYVLELPDGRVMTDMDKFVKNREEWLSSEKLKRPSLIPMASA